MKDNKDVNDRTDFDDYVKNSDTSKLIDIIKGLEDYEEVSAALIELSARNKEKMMELGIDILSNELGDKYLQGFTFTLVYAVNPIIAIETISNKISNIDKIVLNDIISELATDCFQDVAREIPDKLLKEIKARYIKLSKEDKEYILEEYQRFEIAYKDRL